MNGDLLDVLNGNPEDEIVIYGQPPAGGKSIILHHQDMSEFRRALCIDIDHDTARVAYLSSPALTSLFDRDRDCMCQIQSIHFKRIMFLLGEL